jgi:t-SNARE complex subunit (syntaxin)
MSKSIKAEELKTLQSIVEDINKIELQIGQVESRKHQLLHSLSEPQERLSKFQEEMKEAYGDVAINIQTGEYKEETKDEPNTED